MLTEIIIVRHGETDWNIEEVFRGRADVKLNDKGLRQANSVGNALSNVNLVGVYTSPLSRALDTAKEIARSHKLDVIKVDGLIDMDFGEWEGLKVKEVETRYKPLYEMWRRAPQKLRVPGGENLTIVTRRAWESIQTLLKTHGRIAIVSHRVVNKVLICRMLGLDNSHFWNIRQDPCAVNRFKHEDGFFSPLVINDRRHLREVSPICKDF